MSTKRKMRLFSSTFMIKPLLRKILYGLKFALTNSQEALDGISLNLIGHAPLLRTNSEALINRFRITSFPKLIVLRDGKTSYYMALSPRDMRDHRRLLSWMKSVWLPMVPELSAANSHEVMQGRTVVLAILDRTLKDFEQTKQK